MICNGTTESQRVPVDPGAFLTGITLQQFSAARAGFTVWE